MRRPALALLLLTAGAAPAAAMPPNPVAYNDHLVGQEYRLARAVLHAAMLPRTSGAAAVEATKASCAQIDAAANSMAAEVPFIKDGSLRDAITAALRGSAELCREDYVAVAQLLNSAAMTEARLKEADAVYMAALAEEQALHDQVRVAQAAFAKRHHFVLVEPPPLELPKPALPPLPETGLGFEDHVIAATALSHHNHMLGQMNAAIEATNTLLSAPIQPGAPLAEALPNVVTKVARARTACDEAGPWFDDETLLEACVKLTNGLSRLLSGPMAELSLLTAEPKWSAGKAKKANAYIAEINGELPIYVALVQPAADKFQASWGSKELMAFQQAQGAAEPTPAP
ncbi:MAG: hypothetical protein JNM72_12380 [Deltaproteobacteria bacterium]|nr:hypothetical protein [Deltaproteobacteria bacterium]